MHQAGVRAQRYDAHEAAEEDLFDYMRSNVLDHHQRRGRGRRRSSSRIEVMGEDRVMYAMDYPYQFVRRRSAHARHLDIPLASKKKLMQTNAERWFKL